MLGIGAFDIETENWDRFVVGCVLDGAGNASVYWNERECFEAVANYEGELWTWAGGRFDMVWIAQMAVKLGVPASATMSGGQIVSLKIGRAVIKDGYKLYPVPLATAAAIAGVEKTPTGLACRRDHATPHKLWIDSDCGGYCRIKRRGMTAAERKALAEYLVNDCRTTSAIVHSLLVLADQLGIVLKSTVGASAWATLMAMGAPKAEWTRWRDYKLARRAYYGGRTEIYKLYADVIYKYDLNSAYPAALVAMPVPTGGYRILSREAAGKAYRAGKPGAYAAIVEVPECHSPPLPTRGHDRLLFVTGRFEGSWYRDELATAESLGTKILIITGAIVWDTEEKVCAPFMETYWGHRARFGKKSPQGAWLKWFVNSLTGKLAMRPEGERIVLNPPTEKIKRCPGGDWCYDGMLCGGSTRCCDCEHRGSCGRWEPIDKAEHIYSAPTYQLADCAHVQWAGVLTGSTRIELGQQLRHAGDDAALCDTDSCQATRPLTRRIGKELGEWNDEGMRVDRYSPAPKCYRDADPETGEYQTTAKGVPDISAIDFDRWRAGSYDAPLDRGVWGIKGGARRGKVFGRRKLARGVHPRPALVGGRKCVGGAETAPLSWSEYQDLVDRRIL